MFLFFKNFSLNSSTADYPQQWRKHAETPLSKRPASGRHNSVADPDLGSSQFILHCTQRIKNAP
jgi:hypothetical protein